MERGIALYRESGGREGLKHSRVALVQKARAPKGRVWIRESNFDRWLEGLPPLPGKPEHVGRSAARGVPERQRARATPAA